MVRERGGAVVRVPGHGVRGAADVDADDEGRSRGYYVNIQSPLAAMGRRVRLRGLVPGRADPARSSTYEWKDEDELDEAVERGLITADEALRHPSGRGACDRARPAAGAPVRPGLGGLAPRSRRGPRPTLAERWNDAVGWHPRGSHTYRARGRTIRRVPYRYEGSSIMDDSGGFTTPPPPPPPGGGAGGGAGGSGLPREGSATS